MPKKEKRTEQEVHAMIVKDSAMRLGCAGLAPDFTLHETREQWANWDVPQRAQRR